MSNCSLRFVFINTSTIKQTMRKNYFNSLLVMGSALLMLASANAQTSVLFQNFEASKTTAPAGWTQQVAASDPSNKGWKFGSKFPGVLASYIPSHTYYTFVDDYQYNTSLVANNDTLYSPVFSCSGQNHVFVSFDLMYAQNTGLEMATLIASNDGGVTWNTMDTLYPDANDDFNWQDSLEFDISSVAANQANVKIAVTYFDGEPNGYGSGAQGLGIALDNIDVFAPLSYDLSVASQNLPYLMQTGKAYTFTGTVANYGGNSITSMTLNYSVNGGAAKTDNISGITGFNSLTLYNFSHSVSFTPPTAGVYTVKFWANNLNGANVDQFHANDTLTVNFMAIDSIKPKVALFEDVVGQSCYYCMLAAPNVDSVSAKNPTNLNVIHYHVPYPGPPDYMYDAATTVGDSMISYYNVSGTPTGELDGQVLYPGALAAPQDLSTPNVAQDLAVGSAFKINIASATYTTNTNTYSVSANITAYGNFPAGLSAKAVLVVDSITYTKDYSSDDPQSGFAPPIGTTPGGDPDNLFPYLLKFPTVAEAFLTPYSGTPLNAFTSGQTQTLNGSWTKNHAWSDSGKQYPYDSSITAHIVVFVQSNSGAPSVGIPAQYVLQSASALVTNIVGINEISNGVSFGMYPNPTNSLTHIAYKLDREQNVSIGVYNMLGEEVLSLNQGMVSAGQHEIMLDGTSLSSGVYTVRFIADGASTAQKLIIQR